MKKAIKELEYNPDMIAKSLSLKLTKTVAIIVDDMENPIFPAIINGFQTESFKNDYSVYICNIIDETYLQAQISKLIAQRVDGVYISLLI